MRANTPLHGYGIQVFGCRHRPYRAVRNRRSLSATVNQKGCMTFGALLYFKESRYVTSGALNFDVQYRIHLRISIPVSLLTITERLATLQQSAAFRRISTEIFFKVNIPLCVCTGLGLSHDVRPHKKYLFI